MQCPSHSVIRKKANESVKLIDIDIIRQSLLLQRDNLPLVVFAVTKEFAVD